MYSASNAFHRAAKANDEPQVALMVFEDAIFSNSDINVENGVEFDDYFNTEEDIAIGQALSNEIRFTLFNDDRTLNDYEFGEFRAMIGVRISTGAYIQRSPVMTFYNQDVWCGYKEYPYLTLNGSAISPQPTFPVQSIAVYDGKVYVFGTIGYYKVYDVSGAAVSVELNAFMRSKVARWENVGFNLDLEYRTLRIFSGGMTEIYEFVPLGVFDADRPDSPDVIEIDISCNDRMMRFDKDMPDKATLGITYPTTIGTLFTKLCNYVGVPYRTSTFINSTATISKEPREFENATMRTVIGWIAEAAGSNAKFDRDGYLTMAWLKSTSQRIDETQYESCLPCWYETQAANKVYNRDTAGGTDGITGSGDRGYLIQDNPLLKGAST